MRLLLLLLLASCAATPELPKQRGLSFAAAHPRLGTYGSPRSAESLRNARALGVDWISVMPFGFHSGTPALRFGGSRVWETDDSLVAVTKQAHALGIKVMLKLHVWGRTELKMEDWTEADWRAWFDDYGRFVEHYARLARDANADAFCIGNEQKVASRHEAEWRTLIARSRAIYEGPVTYGANFDEVFDVPFWDAVDWIGVSGYFPLSADATPSRDTLVEAWQPILTRLEALSRRHRRPVLFTEIGYRSANGAAWRQWEIPHDVPPNAEAQRVAYEAFFEAAWPRAWVLGAYPWKWFSYPGHATPNDYDFEGKPAADVIRRAFTRPAQ
ncbi:MAG TPA: hypothetical protein VGF28_02295 [Thermoanaerobaculia bacterium]